VPDKQLLALLQQGQEEMQLGLSESQCQQLIAYVELLDKWNKAFNLSAIRDPQLMVSRHLLDSLTLLPRLRYLQQQSSKPMVLLDVGTGGGLPGIPLSIALPEMAFYLLDSNGKKTRFLFQTITALSLGNVTVENCRIESYQCAKQIDIVVSRAFSSLSDFAAGCQHLCQPHTRLLAMKGVYPESELAELSADWQLVASQPLSVPGCEGERQLIELMQNPTI
jgi:16S rRNA (guanine527-N7)-methyltransferase